MNENEQETPNVSTETPPAPEGKTPDANQIVQKAKNMGYKLQNVGGWSWGAFMLTPVFVIGSRKYIYMLMYLLYFIPILGPLVILGFKIYLGLNVGKLLDGSKAFANKDEEVGFVKGINHVGFVLFIFSIIIFIIVILFFGTIFATMFSAFGGGGIPNVGGYRY